MDKPLQNGFVPKLRRQRDPLIPLTIAVEDALNIDSPLWNVLNDDIQQQSAVPYCSRRQLIDLVHTLKRCLEEIASTKEEIARMFSHFEGKLKVLDT